MKGTELMKHHHESNIKLNNSPTRNSNSSSRGELRRTNSASTNKNRRFEENEDVTKTPATPPTSSSSPLTQNKHLYFNKVKLLTISIEKRFEVNAKKPLPLTLPRPAPTKKETILGWFSKERRKKKNFFYFFFFTIFQTCPSNEGSDSGHESNVSPKITKNGGVRVPPRPQVVQCESSGYESVVSFTSSLDSEVGVKLIREETEEIHDPGGQSGMYETIT